MTVVITRVGVCKGVGVDRWVGGLPGTPQECDSCDYKGGEFIEAPNCLFLKLRTQVRFSKKSFIFRTTPTFFRV